MKQENPTVATMGFLMILEAEWARLRLSFEDEVGQLEVGQSQMTDMRET